MPHNTWGWTWRFLAAAALDILDLLNPLSWIPGAGIITDVLLTMMAYVLWGKTGLIAGLEVLNPVEPVDAFVPSLTLTGAVAWWSQHRR